MSETELKIKRKELGILIFRTFTRELIINSGPVSIAKLKTIVEKDRERFHHEEPKRKVDILKVKEEKRKEFQEKLRERRLRQQIIQRQQKRVLIQQKQKEPVQERLRLNVPETRLPERFSYLKPTPIEKQEEFGPKIDILILDPNVEAIECPGENEEIIVRGLMGEQRTEIKLTKKEIDDLINKFSELTKIPVTEGIYKVVFGRLILLAVISEVVGSKFLIKKMKPQRKGPNSPPGLRMPPPQMPPQGLPQMLPKPQQELPMQGLVPPQAPR